MKEVQSESSERVRVAHGAAGGELRLTAADRVLVIAPHPGDDILATAGLLQSACAVGAAVQICYVTDGENNPWAQLVVEGRWPFRAADRARWGRRRRAEALAALARLGVPPQSAEFLGFADRGLTDLLASGDDEPVRSLAGAIATSCPTVLAMPSSSDFHPDHSATSVLASFALARLAPKDRPGRVLRYLIHATPDPMHGALRIRLDGNRQDQKLRAVLCHGSQLRWRKRQYLDSVRESERLDLDSPPEPWVGGHAVQAASFARGVLHLECEPRGFLRLGRPILRVALETETGGQVRLAIGVLAYSMRAPVRDERTGEAVGTVLTTGGARRFLVALSLEALAPPRICFVKLEWPAERRLGLFDRAGWRPVPVPGAAMRGGTEVEAIPAAETARLS